MGKNRGEGLYRGRKRSASKVAGGNWRRPGCGWLWCGRLGEGCGVLELKRALVRCDKKSRSGHHQRDLKSQVSRGFSSAGSLRLK